MVVEYFVSCESYIVKYNEDIKRKNADMSNIQIMFESLWPEI